MIPDVELQWYSWGDEFSVYQTGSGDTHLIDLATADVIKALQRATNESMSTDELACNLATVKEEECDQEWVQHIAQVLESLHHLNIIERVLK